MSVGIGERIRALRTERGLSQEEVARRTGVSLGSYGDIERGVTTDPHYSTLRGISHALGVPIDKLLQEEPIPLDEASQEAGPGAGGTHVGVIDPTVLARWRAAVENARGLRESGQTRMTELLSLWRASRERQEEEDARLEYRTEMADLLTQAHKAKTDLFRNITWSSPEARRAKEEARKAGAREVPNADWEEFLEADRFYYRLLGMLEGFELTVLTGDAAAAAEQATADEAAAEHVQSETTPHRVEELEVV